MASKLQHQVRKGDQLVSGFTNDTAAMSRTMATFPILGEPFSALECKLARRVGVQEISKRTCRHLGPHPHLVTVVADVRRVRLKALADLNPALDSSAAIRG